MARRMMAGHVSKSLITLAAFLSFPASAQPPAALPYRTFSVAANDMEPALRAGDLIGASMLQQTPARGDVVIVRRGTAELVKRVVGLPGDRIGMTRGAIRLNGKPARYERASGEARSIACRNGTPTLLREWLIETSRPTTVIDCHYGVVDDLADVIVPSDHYFLLGDNRHLSADSRISPQQLGLGMVPARDIIGRVRFIYWSKDPARIGQRVE